MDGRIKERLIEAGLYTVVNGNAYPAAMSSEENEVALQNFTQLIVKDCMEIVRSVRNLCESPSSQLPAAASLHIAEKNISAYFGVK